MRITFFCQYYPPEMGAPAARTAEHAQHWAAVGHAVTVITGMPNHPTGIIHPDYRGAWLRREKIAGVELLRSWVYVTPNKGFLKRILNFLSFLVTSLLAGVLLTRRPDVVVGTSPQFFCALAAYLLSVVKRVPFVFEVRDIWPQSAIELGVLRNRVVIAVLETMESFLYRRAALIVPVAEATRDYLLAKGISAEKIVVIPNGIDAGYLAAPSLSAEGLRVELGLQGQFIVSYIGTHGMSHALEQVLEAAGRLPDVFFLLVGEGAEKAKLKAQAQAMKLTNLRLIDQQPRDRLFAFYRASDVGIVPLKKLPLFQKVLPSKLFELMGNGVPLICSVAGEAAELVERAGGGLCIEPENVEALISAIERLCDDAALRRQLSARGRDFVLAHYLRETLAARYVAALQERFGSGMTAHSLSLPEAEAVERS
ncbi:MAG: glycosyltransferase family 4 protein [Acidobacteria bacterium]|nr:glycosyltransferase family 4 protein [Acidobacteriota bacterium]